MAPRWQTLLEEPDEEESSSAPDMIIEEAIEVPQQEAPLGRTLSMAEVREELDPIASLRRARDEMGGGHPILAGGAWDSETTPESAIRALATGFGSGWTADLAKSAGQVGTAVGLPAVEDFVAPLREQDRIAQEEESGLYGAANMLGAALSPANKIALLAKGKGVVANLLAQAGIGGATGFTRTYGDTGDVGAAGEVAARDAAISGLLSAPQAAVSTLGTRMVNKAENPRNIALREQEYQQERLRSAGVGSGQIDNLPPDKLRQTVALIEDMNAQGGGRLTVPEMGYELGQYVDKHRANKNAAFSPLSERGAEVDTNDMAAALRAEADGFTSNPSARESARARATLEDMAGDYDALPATGVAIDEYTPVEAYPEVAYPQPQGAQPPRLPPRAPRASAPPLPVPPSPRVAARAPVMPAAPPARPSARAPQRQVVSHSNVPEAPEDAAISALAAQAPPEPDDLALLMEREMQAQLEATPGAMSPDELIEQDIATQLEREAAGGPPAPRPSARYSPPPEADGALMGREVQGSGRPSARYQPPPQPAAPPPPDPVGALAARGQAYPPPLPPPPPEEFLRGVPGEPNAIPITAERVGVPIAEWNPERHLIGEAAGNALTPPEAANQFRDPQYAASVDAMRTGMLKVDPQLAHQWDASNYSEGLGRMLQDEAKKARNLQTPGLLDYSSNKAALIGGSLGAGIGSLVLPGVGTGVGAAAGAALGKGAGYALNRYMEPRAHTLKADWLSGDTLGKAQRVERAGQFPTGSLVGSFGDLMRGPPPEIDEPAASDPNGPTSSLSSGEFLGRNTTQAMINNPDIFMAYADDYSQAGTDDRRAAVTERLYRTDPKFAKSVFPTIGSEIA